MELDARNMSANQLALAIRVPANRITAILRAERSITPDSAVRYASHRRDRYKVGSSMRLWAWFLSSLMMASVVQADKLPPFTFYAPGPYEMNSWGSSFTPLDEYLTEDLWLTNYSVRDPLRTTDALFWSNSGEPGTELDFFDLSFRIGVVWNDDPSQLRFAVDLFDDFYVQDPEGSDGLCGGRDSVWIDVDFDNDGQNIQRSQFYWPPSPDGSWHILRDYPSATWQNIEYAWTESHTLDFHEESAALLADWHISPYRKVGPEAPDDSDRFQLSACDLIGLRIYVCDTDPGEEDTLWQLVDPAVEGTFVLPQCYLVEDLGFSGSCPGTAIRDVTWGRMKSP